MKLLNWIALSTFIFNVSFAIAAPKNSEVKENQASYSMQNALTITTQEREIIIDQNGQALSQFKYKITNNTDKPNRQVVYSQDMQLDLENTLQPKQSLSLNLQIPFAKIEEKYRPAFLNTQEKIEVYKVARLIVFSDKTTLTEKE